MVLQPEDEKDGMEPIQHVWIDHDNDLVDLTIGWTKHTKHGDQHEDETIHTNQKHPFLTVEAGFVPVSNLNVGMHLVEGNGQIAIIEDRLVIAGSQTMYNLTVQQDHTYTVGDGQFVVHNEGPCNVVSSIHDDPGLVKEAEKMGTNQRAQSDTDHLIQQFSQENTNPGKGSGSLFGNIRYLRGQSGARVFYRMTDRAMDIVGKASKANEGDVIRILTQLYGK